MLDLAACNQYCGARGKADDHRVRDEIDQRTESGKAECQLINTGKESKCQR